MDAPSAAERKRKSRMENFASMSEEELAGYKADERERIRKAVQMSQKTKRTHEQ